MRLVQPNNMGLLVFLGRIETGVSIVLIPYISSEPVGDA